jgi:stage III sporulation protein AD
LRDAGWRSASLVGLAGGILLLWEITRRLAPIIEALSGLSDTPHLSSLLSLSLRAVAICLLVEVTAGLCRDLGEGGLAARLEWCGRLEILFLALPKLTELIALATGYVTG